MRLTLIHPCIGRRAGDKRYLRTWQMQPLPAAMIAGLTPQDVDVRFYDDRMEAIPYDEPTDLVAISVETYTARRAYQIASAYRRRGVPVVMGGFHATLCPDEVAQYADIVVIGEAEDLWAGIVDDVQAGTWRRRYRAPCRPRLGFARPDRRIFSGKHYLNVQLVEAGRGCHFRCEFCAIQSFFSGTQNRRPVDAILSEIADIGRKRDLYFFVDDNITSNMDDAKEFYRALIPLGIRWVSQASINAAHDEEFLDLISRAGCQGVLIGFESLDRESLRAMGKGFNLMGGGYEKAMANLRRFGIRLYGTFIFGYDHDTPDSFDAAVDFAMRHRMFIAAFNHLTPFPGTPLYARLQQEGRLISDAWWLDPDYHYNQLPFRPAKMTPDEVHENCVRARARFFSLPNIARRMVDGTNCRTAFMLKTFLATNLMLGREVFQRDQLPLGDAGCEWPLEPVGAAGSGEWRNAS
ncbi:B12-binding domain-containing radical SAM protein [Neoroseomonas oryzicola]|uniref:B12-binding domain-containing radical SAM protein n=1 Tax=Neoroseomonas oryzicola TaxID=535904 RepID=A0A9X9WJY9_9PROT|nr:radical SAM protein [Neoroseomonas oryzicola]MBR0660649.1 B12-binding domain-containing radical SAM protein [Neoroseomonas oryzicola]NKE19993.1 B12-binding domain-containing radical SAM protein [Neoroseomonas oryzicola]